MIEQSEEARGRSLALAGRSGGGAAADATGAVRAYVYYTREVTVALLNHNFDLRARPRRLKARNTGT